ncbi:2Fe-2S iron-sulfur cluster-binding protein [Piscinibacter sp. XHJ-5]|uniref:2Fe-2S iron-sulfur cluster-binding protein n=1 Tax=Piscinibacter sp. XHJ-5 TaxID=3037797 RepID=UPI002453102B|nr:2Fe-2S iron-sulfur cluster-binding protein [Piscinibacter sp. XHJ-5]
MPALTVIEFNGKEHRIDAEVGKSAMQVVIDAMVPGIMADCGGACSCATCHCYVEAPWATRLPEPVPAEREMLECALDPQPNSRLSCQIRITPHTEGLVIRLPQSQV